MLLAGAVIAQLNKDAAYEISVVGAEQLWPPSEDFPQKVERYFRASLALSMLFFAGLWSVKISFLLFFRRLGHKVNGQKYLWWTVLVVTLAAYVLCVCTKPFKCQVSSFAYIMGEPAYTFLLLCPLTDMV